MRFPRKANGTHLETEECGDFGLWVCEEVSAGPKGGAGIRIAMRWALRVAQKMAKSAPATASAGAFPGGSLISRDLGSLQERPGLRNTWVPPC